MPNEELKAQNLERVFKTTYDLFLVHGIEKTTKEMIARESGLSRKSIDRYFANKTDCVITVSNWALREIKFDFEKKFNGKMLDNQKLTGAQLLEMYMHQIKNLFFEDPRFFVLYTEYKMYIYRNCEDFENAYSLFWSSNGSNQIRKKIYNLGIEDGSLPKNIVTSIEEEYFCESFFGFLSNLAISYNQHSKAEIETQINNRIKNTILLYSHGAYSQPFERKQVATNR